MWCELCRQDTPGVASGDGDKPCCMRCGHEFDRAAAEQPTAAGEAADVKTGDSAPSYDGWELDQRLQHIERIIQPRESDDDQAEAAYKREAFRLDPPHAGVAPWHLPPSRLSSPRKLGKSGKAEKRAGAARPHILLTMLIWLALSLGTMAFACGGILLGWSILSDRAELWNLGLPVTLCGQIALLVGLVLQLDRLWHDSRHAAAKLDDVDEQLHELQTTTTMLTTGHNSPGGAFYSHLTAGAGPQILLSDLKSQLDLLAVKIGQREQ